MLARARASLGRALGSGPNLLASFGTYDPASSSWRTCQLSFLSGEEAGRCSGTLPRAGMMRSGTAYPLPPSAPLTAGIGSLSSPGAETWPTPTASEDSATGNWSGNNRDTWRPSLRLRVLGAPAMWPTPDASAAQVGEQPATWRARQQKMAAKGYNANGCGTPLGMAVKLWPTPTVHGNSNQKGISPAAGDGLTTAVKVVAGWPTPTARDGAAHAGGKAQGAAGLAEPVGPALGRSQVGGRRGGRRVRGDAQPGLGRAAHGLPGWLDRGFPAGPGQEQHPWEAPRILARVPRRGARLRAAGNAVSPVVAYVIGCLLMELAQALEAA